MRRLKLPWLKLYFHTIAMFGRISRLSSNKKTKQQARFFTQGDNDTFMFTNESEC